ncbi:PDR/VanB family oxidoreductase [Microbacterium aquimaris]|uniref:PDR/VanB family oxidoreductase n=1 Tax=Microbacterium aquimaris TaxID=459816 RepID=UPI002AD3F7F7|nr:PDR/VanB family oxidoreductase [Microbacterium aquimaris]MDZ8274621.1 PDR/VanB family oxidoreductase [Microbacterium aquimaris]
MSYFSDVERDLVITARTEVADGVVALDLASPNGRDLPAWTPGSHIDVILPTAVPGEVRERQYSLCSDPAERGSWRIAVLREDTGRGGSAHVHETAEVGRRMRVRGPRNHFPFRTEPGQTYRFVAGGIGITPIHAMVGAAAAAGVDWHLDYAGRSRRTMAFVDALTAAHPDRVTVHAADEGARMDVAALAGSVDQDTRIYACGPSGLLEALDDAFPGEDGTRLHLERFEAKEFGEPVWTDPFEVELAMSGEVVTVEPGQSVLEAVLEQSPETVVLSSCRRGTCGTCEVPVLEGEIEHRDSVLTPVEREDSTVMMMCVSRAACPRIVLDI